MIGRKVIGRIPLAVIGRGKFSKIFIGVGEKISKYSLNLKYDLRKSSLELEDKEYISIAFANSILYLLLFFSLFFVLIFIAQHNSVAESLMKSFVFSAIISLLMFVVLIKYPKIIAGKKAELVDKHLTFALKDMALQISSGVSLYNSMVNISNSNYGEVSMEFARTVRKISSGTPVEKALQALAVESSSEFMRRTVWQLINTIKVGASLRGSLRAIINELTIGERDRIRSYSRELNMWVLAYMLFAVAVPTIGTTVMMILAGFAGYNMTKGIFVLFLLINFAIQCILIGFVKYRRPVVNF